MNYFTSDLHLGHNRILDFERGDKFKTIVEHDDFVMSVLEKRVKKDDVLYNLGDFAFKNVSDEILERYRKLPCKKVIILGNHDTYNKIEKMQIFDEIHRTPIFLTKRILLSHEPEMCSPYVLNIHGHLHLSYLDSENHLNVNIYMQNYNLISQKYVDKKLGHLEEYNNCFGAEWYYDKYIFLKAGDDKVLTDDFKIDKEKTEELWKNTFEIKEIDGEETDLKKIGNRKEKSLWIDRNGNYFISHWDMVDKREKIEKANIEIKELDNNRDNYADFERWDRIYINGKKYKKMFPKAKNSEKYMFIKEK